ncbi:hypothetical protein K8I61_20510 [bacterium]|nr:hypothetical protein [bacterium]
MTASAGSIARAAGTWHVTGALAAGCVVLRLLVLNRGLVWFDEGEVLYYVERILRGEIPARDFAINSYGLVRYYALAALLSVTGVSLTALHLIWIGVQAAATIALHRLALRAVSPLFALAPPVAFLLAPGPAHKAFWVLGMLAAALAGHGFVTSPARRGALVLAAVVFGATLLRLDIGAAAAGGAMLASWLVRRRGEHALAKYAFIGALASLALAFALPIAFHAATGTISPALAQFADEVQKNLAIEEPRMPAPWTAVTGPRRLDALLLWWPIVALAAMAAHLLFAGSAGVPPASNATLSSGSAGVRPSSKEKTAGPTNPQKPRDLAGSTGSSPGPQVSSPASKYTRARLAGHAVVALVCLAAAHPIRVKPDISHALQAAPFAVLLSAIVLQALRDHLAPNPRWPLSTSLVAALVFASVLPFAAAVTHHPADPYTGAVSNRFARARSVRIGRDTLRLFEHEAIELRDLLTEINALGGECDRLFAPTNQPLLYFLSGRRDPTGYPSLVFYADSVESQDRVIERLRQNPPRVVAYIDDSIEGDARRLANAAPIVRRFLYENFKQAATVGHFYVLENRNIPDPAGICGPKPTPLATADDAP